MRFDVTLMEFKSAAIPDATRHFGPVVIVNRERDEFLQLPDTSR
jgi:hypothetical protein